VASPHGRPTIQQMHRVVSLMPASSPIEKRDRALIAFTMLTGARDGTLVTFKLRHVDLEQQCVDQDSRDVRTKFAKSFLTWFYPVGGHAFAVVNEWVAFLRNDSGWSDDDPLFPATRVIVGADQRFKPDGL